jgi:hypothetical protein
MTQGVLAPFVSEPEVARNAAEVISVEDPVAITETVNRSLRAARSRWAELLRRICEVDPLPCPLCSARRRS